MAEKIKACVKFSFPAVLSFVLCTDKAGTAVFCLLSCLLHELGHIIVLFGEGNIPRKITFCGGGIRLDVGSRYSVPALLGGCFANFLLFCLFCFAYDEKMQLFAAVNLLTGALNLLPIRPLDGGMLLERFLLCCISSEKIGKVMPSAEAAVGVIFILAVIYMFIKGLIGISSFSFLAYLLGLEIIEKQ